MKQLVAPSAHRTVPLLLLSLGLHLLSGLPSSSSVPLGPLPRHPLLHEVFTCCAGLGRASAASFSTEVHTHLCCCPQGMTQPRSSSAFLPDGLYPLGFYMCRGSYSLDPKWGHLPNIGIIPKCAGRFGVGVTPVERDSEYHLCSSLLCSHSSYRTQHLSFLFNAQRST